MAGPLEDPRPRLPSSPHWGATAMERATMDCCCCDGYFTGIDSPLGVVDCYWVPPPHFHRGQIPRLGCPTRQNCLPLRPPSRPEAPWAHFSFRFPSGPTSRWKFVIGGHSLQGASPKVVRSSFPSPTGLGASFLCLCSALGWEYWHCSELRFDVSSIEPS